MKRHTARSSDGDRISADVAAGLRPGRRRTAGLRAPPRYLALIGLLLPASAFAQPAEDAESRLSVLLGHIEFNGAEKADELGEALAEFEPADLAKLCEMLVASGSGDDTKARMALEGLAWYLGDRGTPEQRTKYVDVLCDALEGDRPDEVKAFLIRQLQLVGDARAVPTLAKLFQNEELYDSAAQALLAIGGEEAAKVFREALPTARGPRRIAAIDALGLLGDRESIPMLAASVGSPDRDLYLAVMAAWRNIGDRYLPAMLTETYLEARSPYERSCLYGCFLGLGERLAQDGEQLAVLSLKTGVKGYPTLGEPHAQCAALYALASALGAGAVDTIVDVMAYEDPVVRAAAVDLTASMGDSTVTAEYVKKLVDAGPDVRAAILKAFGRRGDAAVLPVVLRALQDADPNVRLAAVDAAGKLGGEQAVLPLVAFLDTDQDDERQAARRALARIRGEQVARQIAAGLDGARPRVCVALLDLLAGRRARDQLDVIFAHTRHQDESVRVAAIRAIEVLGDESSVPKLLQLLTTAQTGRERDALEQALAATCQPAGEPAAGAALVLTALQPQDTQNYCSLLRVLGRIGGAGAWDALRVGLADTRDEVRQVAFEALLDWPDPAAAAAVLQIAIEADHLQQHVLAMRAYARLVALDEHRTPERKLDLYAAGMQAARRPEEQRLLLSKMGAVHDQRALRVLEPYLADAAVRDEAAAAMISVADGLLPGGWAAARPALRRVLSAVADETTRQRGEEAMQRVAECEDFVTDWLVAGPYTQPGRSGSELFDVAFRPEEPGAQAVEWHQQPVTADPARYWYVDLQGCPGVAGNNRAAYLFTRVYSPQGRDVLLELGSDDGIKVWLNHQVVHLNNAVRGCARGDDTVVAHLNSGWNDLLLKVVNGGGAWGACLRVRAPDGGHLDDVYAKANRDE